ncbi:hypothetical protein [Pseudanabaena sp. lw0831]|uniref:hypothetical protein n=1 Tax=Pseudanabaena sp. lw0831 TaxID=1357935 RepID=UPI001915054B|nr:hypothetical protein [Pseudanabaena sp. lw0831]
MMTYNKYQEQAKSNHKSAQSSRKTFPDWAVTMCFYTALHWVEYYACLKSVDISVYGGKSPHDCRRLYVRELAKELNSRTLRKAYEELEKESKKSRYLVDLSTDAIVHYKLNNLKVDKAFQNLQIISVLLSS